MADNWLSTDAMIAEVCDDAVKNYGGTTILSIRCPDKEIQAKVRKYLDSKRGGKTIDTYVGGPNDSVAALIENGDGTRSKPRRKTGDDTPVTPDEDDGEMTPEQIAVAEEVEEWPRDAMVDAMIGDDPPVDDELEGLV